MLRTLTTNLHSLPTWISSGANFWITSAGRCGPSNARSPGRPCPVVDANGASSAAATPRSGLPISGSANSSGIASVGVRLATSAAGAAKLGDGVNSTCPAGGGAKLLSTGMEDAGGANSVCSGSGNGEASIGPSPDGGCCPSRAAGAGRSIAAADKVDCSGTAGNSANWAASGSLLTAPKSGRPPPTPVASSGLNRHFRPQRIRDPPCLASAQAARHKRRSARQERRPARQRRHARRSNLPRQGNVAVGCRLARQHPAPATDHASRC